MAESDNRIWWLLGGLAALLFLGRKSVLSTARMISSEIDKARFKLTIPNQAAPYADDILLVARDENVSPFLIVALGMRETRWGTARGLDTPGPGGRGDAGHGHGLMQIDDRFFGEWLARNNWQIPFVNIKKGVQILKGKLVFLASKQKVTGLTDGVTVTVSQRQAERRGVTAGQYRDPRPLTGDLLNRAAVAAYNTGEMNVLYSLAVGRDPDWTTAAGPSGKPDYSSDVLATAATLQSKFQT